MSGRDNREYSADPWKPISSAPLDGTVVDLWCHFSPGLGGGRFAGYYWDKKYWVNDEGGTLIFCAKPINWMLPPPPPFPDLNENTRNSAKFYADILEAKCPPTSESIINRAVDEALSQAAFEGHLACMDLLIKRNTCAADYSEIVVKRIKALRSEPEQ